jgi:flavodoxin
MKKTISLISAAVIMLLFLASCSGSTQPDDTTASELQPQPEEITETVSESETVSVSKTLVVYFSQTGNTRPIAEFIAKDLDADIYEIKAEIPYTDDDIKYYTDCRADREQKDPSARPAIAGELPDLTEYDTVYLGYPIWHGQAPKIIYTFIEGVDLSGKTVVPFCTSGSSPVGTSAENLHPLAPDAVWKDGTRFAAGTSEDEIAARLNK